MENFVLTLVLVIGFILVIAIMMQPSKQQDALSSLSGGGGSDLFIQQKSRGFDAIIKRFTAVTGIVWLLLCLFLMYLENK